MVNIYFTTMAANSLGVKEMEKSVKTKFTKGVFTPLEGLDLPEGTHVTIHFFIDDEETEETTKPDHWLDEFCGAWQDEHSAEEQVQQLYQQRSKNTRASKVKL